MDRQYSLLDKLIIEIEHALKTTLEKKTITDRASPADSISDESLLNNEQIKKSSSLMRVDHTGEVCAQALYRGQAFVTKNASTRNHLWHAADEESDHLAWCQKRLNELDSRSSFLNPFWYVSSFVIGSTSGLISDKFSYSFVVETEQQVMRHLDEHLNQLPKSDKKSAAILEKMRTDEAMHAQNAEKKGGSRLPLPIRIMMKLQSKVMTTTAYYC